MIRIDKPTPASRRVVGELSELASARLDHDDQVTDLTIIESARSNEIPVGTAEVERRTVTLQPLLDAHPALESLCIEANASSKTLTHPKVRRVTLVGAIATARLSMANLVELVLELAGDEAGCAVPFDGLPGCSTPASSRS